jgi:ABC-type transport system substrate-binding protein
VKLFPHLEAVSLAVNSGEVDMVYGLDTIDPGFFRALQAKGDSDNWATLVSGPLATRVLRFNSGTELLSSLAVRKALLHSVNKQVGYGYCLAGLL